MSAQRPCRVDSLDKTLERQILICVGVEIRGAHAIQQFAEAGITGGVGAQHHGVHEKSDQVVERVIGSSRDRAADRDVRADAEPREQRGEAGLEHHEEAGLLLARQHQQALVQFRRDLEGDSIAMMAGNSRPRNDQPAVPVAPAGHAAPSSSTLTGALSDFRDHLRYPAARAAKARSRHIAGAAA